MITLYLWPTFDTLDFWFVDENNTLVASGNEQLGTGMILNFSRSLTINEIVDKINSQTNILLLIHSIKNKFPAHLVQAIVWTDYTVVQFTMDKKKQVLSSLSLEDLKGITPGLTKLAK